MSAFVSCTDLAKIELKSGHSSAQSLMEPSYLIKSKGTISWKGFRASPGFVFPPLPPPPLLLLQAHFLLLSLSWEYRSHPRQSGFMLLGYKLLLLSFPLLWVHFRYHYYHWLPYILQALIKSATQWDLLWSSYLKLNTTPMNFQPPFPHYLCQYKYNKTVCYIILIYFICGLSSHKNISSVWAGIVFST